MTAVAPSGLWRVAAAAVPGASHNRSQLPGQDACAWRELPDGILLAAVADGAGSAPRSGEGARLAVEAVLAGLEACLELGRPTDEGAWRRLLAGAMRGARVALEALAEAESLPLGALATTLSCVVAGPDCLAAAHNGDGASVALVNAGQWLLVGKPERGEYANEVCFLTSEAGMSAVAYAFHPQPPQAVALLTDGLLRLALDLPKLAPHAPFFDPLVAFTAASEGPESAAGELAAFLSSEAVASRTDDDLTLVVAVRIPAGGSAEGLSSESGAADLAVG